MRSIGIVRWASAERTVTRVNDHGLICTKMSAHTAAAMLVYVLLDPKMTKDDREQICRLWNEDVKRNAAQRGR